MQKMILVTGDVVVDHHIYEGQRPKAAVTGQRGVRSVRQHGGAKGVTDLIAELLKQAIEKNEQEKKEKEKDVIDQESLLKKALAEQSKMKQNELAEERIKQAEDAISDAQKKVTNAEEKLRKHVDAAEKEWIVEFGLTLPDLHQEPNGHHALAIWKPCASCQAKEQDKDKRYWRASLLMGYGQEQDENPCADKSSEGPASDAYEPKPDEIQETPEILVIDDAGAKFRKELYQNCWLLPDAKQAKPKWIILKMSSPVCRGDLWTKLKKEFADRLIVIVSAKELRLETANISQGLSWELTIESLRASLRRNPVLRQLHEFCQHLFIIFSGDGALWLNKSNPKKSSAELVYEAASIEGLSTENCEGEALGFMACMIAAITREIIQSQKRAEMTGTAPLPHFIEALKAGLAAMRDLRYHGHGEVREECLATGFPIKRIADVLLSRPTTFETAWVPWNDDEIKKSDPWSILVQSQRPISQDIKPPLMGLAKLVVTFGHAALEKYPHAKFGDLFTADRKEIECLRAMRVLMRDYWKLKDFKRPLSIGVFGPPGAGKSFGVRQVSDEIFGKDAWVEFNLAQFNEMSDLIGAFHQIRDRVLGGITPVVLWDEFDSQEYRWLQYLLAPMQDDKFQEGQITHTIGKCVFVFAGATSYSFQEFGPNRLDREGMHKFRLLKGPDFHSRLDTYYNVLGPNPRLLSKQTIYRKLPVTKIDPSDNCHPLRRALLLRSFLMKKQEGRLDIDSGLLSALLEAPWYRHGARSLEKIALALRPAQIGAPIRRSSLPAPTVLAMHLSLQIDESSDDEMSDADIVKKFLQPADRNLTFKTSDLLARLAPAIHQFWRELGRKEGWLTKENDKDYDQLSDFLKNSNLAAAERMSDILSYVGLRLETGVANNTEKNIVSRYLCHHVEVLAGLEHIGWMDWYRANGWRYAPVRDDRKHLHDCLLPFKDLSEKNKDKDREAIRRYPDCARQARLKIVFAKSV